MTRREFMRLAGAGLAAATLTSSEYRLQAASQSAPAKRPNILVILADDMGFSDIGCYGSEISTPNLDRLAADGLRFTQAYSAARCCPSRAALLTGLYPHQAGMGAMVTRLGESAPTGAYQGYLNDRCVTIAEALKPAGYKTYMSGKWHVGEAPEHWPRKRGFDRYFGLISGASSYFEILPEEKSERTMARDDTPFTPEGNSFYMTNAISDFAIECLENHGQSDQPFFLYLAYTAPHWPLHALPEDIAKYVGKYDIGWDKLRERRYQKQLELGIIDPKWALSPRDPEVPSWDSVENKEDWAALMSVYAAMIDRMDQGIGRVLETLKKIGAEENTLVLFLSDNGGCHEDIAGRKLNKPGTKPGERGSFVAYKRPWANASNTPFRLFKHWVHEGGIATPLIVRWPAEIKKGGMTNQLAHITDIMPTCLDVAGAEYPKKFNGKDITPVVGKSLLPVVDGKEREPHEILYWEHFGNRAVRQGKWKLVATADGDWELYDIEADRTELHSLIEQFPDKAKELNNAWDAWATDCGAKQPPKKG